ncbi:MAG: endolytic transglycosylase MltG [Clostridiales bacterium]|nr:endolytic transglycosylase MltG [Clostridiales bacterium]
MKNILFMFLIISLILIAGCSKTEFFQNFTEAVDSENDTVFEIVIPSGASSDKIADILLDNELITNKLVFKETAKEMGADTKFQAGTYHLMQSMDMNTIIDIISKGKTYEEILTITIPEGFELNQIVKRIEDLGIATEDQIMDVLKNDQFSYKFLEYVNRDFYLEGFLFPDTYIIKEDATAHEVIDKMLNRFDSIFKDDYYLKMDEMNMTMNEIITLASIIEREAKLDSERAIISSVFHNRLDINMKLQSCATIQYALGERKEILTYNDLEIQSDYNTYKYYGLPPAPIASPGEKSIVAALYPDDTEYLFFVTTEKNDGSHYFSKTYEEQIDNKNKK